MTFETNKQKMNPFKFVLIEGGTGACFSFDDHQCDLNNHCCWDPINLL